jgi:hypothetical protein
MKKYTYEEVKSYFDKSNLKNKTRNPTGFRQWVVHFVFHIGN